MAYTELTCEDAALTLADLYAMSLRVHEDGSVWQQVVLVGGGGETCDDPEIRDALVSVSGTEFMDGVYTNFGDDGSGRNFYMRTVDGTDPPVYTYIVYDGDNLKWKILKSDIDGAYASDVTDAMYPFGLTYVSEGFDAPAPTVTCA